MTDCSLTGLERVIAAHLAEWDSAHVELAIYGFDDAAAIARAIDDFCSTHLYGAPSPTRCSIGPASAQSSGSNSTIDGALW
jgi:hypothetical protein